jgi:hypothetical protein
MPIMTTPCHVTKYYTFDVLHPNDNSIQYDLTSRSPFLNVWCLTAVLVPLGHVLGSILLFQTVQISLLLLFSATVPVVVFTIRSFKIRKESLTVIHGVGIQLQRESYCGRSRREFYEREHIHTVVINEGFHLNKVIYYLGFLQRGSKDLLLPFSHILPRLETILVIYKGTYGSLHGVADEQTESLRSASVY